MLLRKNQKIVIIGDSVTDCSRREDYTAYLGTAYPHILAANIYLKYPDLDVKVVNVGISGDTSNALVARWQADVLDNKPDVLVILIGINDVWRYYGCGPEADKVSCKDYIKNVRYMIESVINTTERVIILSPFYLEQDMKKPMKIQTEQYINALKSLVAEYDVTFVDMQKRFDDLMRKYTYNQLASISDKVHPTTFGQVVIADEILKVLEK
jgi:lysophospholipase L1-like esterase